MAEHRLIVFTEPTPGREDEFNAWYDEVHLRDVLEIPGFVAAQRFRLSEAQIDGAGEAAPARYVAIYEIDAESVEPVLASLAEGTDKMEISEALDLPRARAHLYSAIGARRVSG